MQKRFNTFFFHSSEQFFYLVFITDQEDGPTPDKWDDPDEFVEEQNLMGKIIHMLKADNDPDQQYQILSTARKHFGLGGPSRIDSTLPPIVMFAYK